MSMSLSRRAIPALLILPSRTLHRGSPMCWDEPLLLTHRLLLGVALRNLEMMWRTTERQCRREVVSRGDADVENAAKGWGADFCRCGVNDGELLEGGGTGEGKTAANC